jgi:hypothetical protein
MMASACPGRPTNRLGAEDDCIVAALFVRSIESYHPAEGRQGEDPAGPHFRSYQAVRSCWQVLGSNQRRLSRRFLRTLAGYLAAHRADNLVQLM